MMTSSPRTANSFPRTLQGSAPAFEWPESKYASVALTFDDYSPGQRNLLIPILRTYAMTGTFFVVAADLAVDEQNDDYALLNELARSGFEIGNHSRTHRDLTTLDDIALIEETCGVALELSREVASSRKHTFALPFGTTNARVEARLARSHIAARGFEEVPNDLDLRSPTEWNENSRFNHIPLRLHPGLSRHQFGNFLDEVLSTGGLLSTVGHGVYNEEHPDDRGRYDALSTQELVGFLDELAARRDKLWITTFGAAMEHVARRCV